MADERRLIDANDALEKLNQANQTIGVIMGDIAVDGCNAVSIKAVMRFIERCKTVDAAEVVHGRWVNNGIPESVLRGCSVCGFTCGAPTFNYCPNCGAKMDGERKDNE